jgi:pheromone shutdown protein TraB
MSANESRGSFFRRRRNSHRRSKSLGRVREFAFLFSFLKCLSKIYIAARGDQLLRSFRISCFRITGTMWCSPTALASSRPTSA